jgi:hypothetical protein
VAELVDVEVLLGEPRVQSPAPATATAASAILERSNVTAP